MIVLGDLCHLVTGLRSRRALAAENLEKSNW
jgi:hypothetical protein